METYEDAGGFAGDQPSSFKLPYVPKLKLSTILSGDKSAAATELCEYVKKYINSEESVSYTHLRAHETVLEIVCRLLLEKKK